jgi:membrane protein YdbS with pleckstrin-like domain
MSDTAAIVAQPAALADGIERRLDPQFVPFQRAIGWIVTASVSAGLLIGLLIVWLTARMPSWLILLLPFAWLAVACGLAWFSYRWPVVEYRHTSFRLDGEGIEIHSGVVWRTVVSVPRSRVQHIDVSQGPLERSYGLGRLIVYTAGTDHARVELGGLSHGVAFGLRNHLLPKGSDDAV